ncbi:MAG: GGDEF domain-containing protein [Alkalispirochaeta sp.]
MNDTAHFLSAVAIFTDLSHEQRSVLSTRLTLQRLPEGHVLFSQGDPGDALYIVRSGSIEIAVRTGPQEEVPVATLQQGDFLGEMSIFDHAPRSATCRARESSAVLRLDEADFSSLIAAEPTAAISIMYRMLAITAERLDNTSVLLSEMVQWGEEARRRAFTDDLTGLYNRRFLDQNLDDQLARADQEGTSLTVVMMDLDHFTTINEEHGHEVGDQLIAAVTPAITGAFRSTDILVRYGGDEFTFVLPATTPTEAQPLCDALRDAVGHVSFLRERGGSTTTVTCSQGIAAFPEHGRTATTLRERADHALYLAKERGRNRAEIAVPT